MRSDALELPEGVSKTQADQVEIAEARDTEQPRALAATGCEIVWPTTFTVCGAIRDAYKQVGSQLSWLGPPTSNELTNPDGVGKRSNFYGGSIYWHPDTGAYALTNDGMRQWGTLGWESGPLGYPTSGPIDINYPLTQRQTFQGGDNYYNPLTGGAVWGDIKQRYEDLGGSNHSIGIPITNEQANGDQYLYNNFSNGTISWRNDRQTRFMYLATQRVWDAVGRETGHYGFPSGDETAIVPGAFHTVPFADVGVIAWSGLFGAREMTGQTFVYWNSLLNTPDDLGYPLADLVSFADSTAQLFSNATVLGAGENLAVIRNETPLSSGTLPLQSSNFDSLDSAAAMQARANLSAGTRMSSKTPGLLNKLDFPGETRFVVRKGFYNKNANGTTDGWGQDKLIQKHNMSNHNMLLHSIKSAPRNLTVITAKDNYAYTQDVYFVKCGGFSTSSRCDQVEPMQWITVVYRPVVNNTYKGYDAKDPKIDGDNWPVGVVTAYCHDKKEDANGHGLINSRCPNYVNYYSKLV